MPDLRLAGLGPKDRARTLRNRAGRSRFLERNPLAPLTERELLSRAQRDEAASVSPLARLIGQRATAGAQNLEGVYSHLAGNLAGYQGQQADIYNRARTNLQGAQTQGAQELGQSGSAISAALQHQMELSGASGSIAPDLARLQGGQATRGGAELGELALRQAAAEDYAAKLPGFARLAGAQGIRELQAKRQQDIADLTARSSGQLASSLGSARNLEYQKAVAARGFGIDYAKLAQQSRQQRAAEAGRNARAAATVSVSQQRANETERHNAAMEEINNRKGDQTAARLAETERYHRAQQRIAGRTHRTARYRAHHPAKSSKSGGGASGIPSPGGG